MINVFEAMAGRPFADLRRTRFKEFPPEFKNDLEYVEQLAVQTSTNIDSWDIVKVLTGIGMGNRRAINKAFFAHAEANKTIKQVLPDETVKVLESTSKEVDRIRAARLQELANVQSQAGNSAKAHYDSYAAQVKKAWDAEKEKAALENRPANYIAEEIKSLLADGFWQFLEYKEAKLRLATTADIVMVEKNPSAGVDRRINLGRVIGELSVRDMRLKVLKYRQNLVNRQGYFHPYISRDNDICWGNAADTSRGLLATGQVKSVYSLLASLLTSYGNGTPWSTLAEFELVRDNQRVDATSIGTTEQEWCEEHEEERRSCDCGDWCESCDDIYDNCECYICENCSYRSEDAHCPRHWCGICENSDRGNCGCCQECENTEGNCECCSVCGETDCDCCTECGSNAEDCTRCEVCEYHEDHSRTCSNNPANNESASYIF